MTKHGSGEDLQELIRSNDMVVFLYGSSSCAPCTAISQKIDQWNRSNDAVCRYIPLEDFPELSAQRGILSVPTVSVYLNETEIIRESGYFSLEDIFHRIKRYRQIMG